jgi:hypothetical protein
MTTHVPIHGMWHGGWRWEKTSLLRAAGRVAYAPTLAGLAERAHLRSDDMKGGSFYVTEVRHDDTIEI